MTQNGCKRLNLRDSRWFHRKSSRFNQNKLRIDSKNKNKLIKDETTKNVLTLGDIPEIIKIKSEKALKTSKTFDKQESFELNKTSHSNNTIHNEIDYDNQTTPARYNIFLNSALGFDESTPITSPYDSSANPQQFFYIPCQSTRGLKLSPSNKKLDNQSKTITENQLTSFYETLKKDKIGFKKVEKFLKEKISLLSVLPHQQETPNSQVLLNHVNKVPIKKFLDHPISTTGSTTIGSTIPKSDYGEPYNKNETHSTSISLEPTPHEMNSNLGSQPAPSAQLSYQENSALSTSSEGNFIKNHLSTFYTKVDLKEPNKMDSLELDNLGGSFNEEQNANNSLHKEPIKSNFPISNSFKPGLNNTLLTQLGTNGVEYDPNNIKISRSPDTSPQSPGSLPMVNVAYATYNQYFKDIPVPYPHSLNYIQHNQYPHRQDMRIENGVMTSILTPDNFRNPQLPHFANNGSDYKNDTTAGTNNQGNVSIKLNQTLLNVPNSNTIRNQFSLRSPRKYFSSVCARFQQLSKQQYDWLLRSEQYND